MHVGRQYGVLTDDVGNPIHDDDGKPKRGVTVAGEAYYPHRGETIWLLPVADMGTYLKINRLNRINLEQRDEPTFGDDQQDAFVALAEMLAQHTAAWDWTDLGGDPLPQPYKNPDVLIGLDSEVFSYVLSLVQYGPPAEKKSEDAILPNSSSAKVRRQRPRSSDGSANPSETALPA